MAKGDDQIDCKNDKKFVFNQAWNVDFWVYSQCLISPEGSMKVGTYDVNGAVKEEHPFDVVELDAINKNESDLDRLVEILQVV